MILETRNSTTTLYGTPAEMFRLSLDILKQVQRVTLNKMSATCWTALSRKDSERHFPHVLQFYVEQKP